MPPKIILTTVPTGLGHIRVTKALAHGLTGRIPPLILGINDETTSMLYRIISTHWTLRKLLEFTQSNPLVEKLTTNTLNYIQVSHTKKTEILLQTMLQDKQQPVIIVSTHAFIAQKIQKIINKHIFPNEFFHAVVITDDSPQRFWMISANVLFSPSNHTRNQLLKLYADDRKQPPSIEVAPYPINPDFCKKISPEVLYNKIEQLQPDNPQQARICIPVSGAAVQLDFYTTLVEELLCNDTRTACREFTFSIVTRKGTYTIPFINHFKNYDGVAFHIGKSDEQTVELYDQLYHQLNPPSLEITKPSEQCFKALTSPDTIGGPILLLTEPVGRQEYDNLDFLQRHGFLPTPDEHQLLTQALCDNNKNILTQFREKARNWRCLRLPSDPYKAVEFIKNCFSSGIFNSMQNYKGYERTSELAPNGVDHIWSTIWQLYGKAPIITQS